MKYSFLFLLHGLILSVALLSPSCQTSKKFQLQLKCEINSVNLLVDSKYALDIDQTSNINNTLVKQRRMRYKGKYPKSFNEKYKEIGGNEDTVRKVLSKGGTPAGQHVSIMLKECIHHLGLFRNESSIGDGDRIVAVDCTLGYGGHSEAILKSIVRQKGLLLSFDQDAIELEKTKTRLQANFFDNSKCTDFMSNNNLKQDDLFKCINDNFCNIEQHIESLHLPGQGIDAILADLGCSSMQLDDPSRGFTYKNDVPLDMRMDKSSDRTAITVLRENDKDSLTILLFDNSDEVLAKYISESIYSDIEEKELPSTTGGLNERIRRGVERGHQALRLPHPTKKEYEKAITRTMQAIRIEVNREFQSLETLLDSLPRLLRPGGRAVFLTFHSGEDKRVKKAFKTGFKTGVYSQWSRDCIRASFDEQHTNPRSKCAKLRWAVRSENV